jgi:FPC/CPF motif-containing protein YcgG
MLQEVFKKRSTLRLAFKDDGEWKTYSFRTDDPGWRETFKILKDTGHDVKILYK